MSCLGLGLLLYTSASPVVAGGIRTPEQPGLGPAAHRLALPDQLTPAMLRAHTASGLQAQTTPPFLTRAYLGPHYVTSVFDHTHPDYTRDGMVVRFDGVTAQSGCGVDPSFTAGYRICNAQDYLYYDGHNGWDVALNYEPVLASADGTVDLAGWDSVSPGFGISVTISHPNGFTTRYAHLSAVSVGHGDQVRRGQRIATSGNTGNSTGPHLHYGVYVTASWNPVDPYGWTGAGQDPWPADQGDLWLTGVPQDPLPGAPTAVQATAGDASAALVWTPPAYDGGQALAAFTITASPGGRTATVDGSQSTGVVTGLDNGRAYSFTVTAQNAGGAAAVSSASNSVTPAPTWPGRLHPLVPSRIADSRAGVGLGRLGPNQVAAVQVAGKGSVPGTGASGVLVNVTATNGSANGYLTLHSTGVPASPTSSLNFGAWQAAANLVSTGLGPDGRVDVYNGSSGSVDVILDVSGWYSGPTVGGGDGRLRALSPARIADTRSGLGGSGRLGPNRSVSLQVAGTGGVPATGASAAVLNLTVAGPSRAGYLSISPTGQAPAQVSSLNFAAGQTLANRVVVSLGAGGRVDLYNSEGEADAIVDVAGYFTDSAGGTSPPGQLTELTPARIYDTRDGTGSARGALQPNSWVEVVVAGPAGVPTMGVDVPPRAVLINVTVTEATQPSFFAVDPAGGVVRASDLNFVPGQTAANLVVAPVGPDGRVWVYNSQGTAHLIVDVYGWFS